MAIACRHMAFMEGLEDSRKQWYRSLKNLVLNKILGERERSEYKQGWVDGGKRKDGGRKE